MANYTPTPVGNLSNQVAAVNTINENLENIAEALETKLNRDGALPNQMEADLDMNGNDLLNVGEIRFGNGVSIGGDNPWPGGGGGGGGGSITVRDEGTIVASVASSLNFTGPFVQATASGSAVTVKVSAEDALLVPRFWQFIGNGVDTEFFIPDADVEDTAYYDVAVNGVAQNPGQDYTVIVGTNPSNSLIRFDNPIPNGQIGWAVLRTLLGQAVSLVSPQLRVITVGTTTATLDATFRQGHILCTNSETTTLTLRANTGDINLDWKAGDYFSLIQKGTGQVVVVPDVDVNIEIPDGFAPRTRARYSPISFVCDDPSTNTWSIGNDMAAAV